MSTSTFIVRNANTRQLVGLFCARRSNDLFSLLDERVDPFACEYLELVPGEGLFVGKTGIEARTEVLAAREFDSCWRGLDLAGFASARQIGPERPQERRVGGSPVSARSELGASSPASS